MQGLGGQIEQVLLLLSVWALPVIVAVTLHEAAHGWAADRLGDPTAREQGRVTLNPLPHIDRFGTVILPLLCIIAPVSLVFGYARPVPVNLARLRHPRRDMMLVAAAGPAANVGLCLLSAVLLGVAPDTPGWLAGWVAAVLKCSILLNAVLAVFNMLPVPPLDGGRIVTGLLPAGLAVRYARLERYGLILVIAVLIVLPLIGDGLGVNLGFLASVLSAGIYGLIDLVFAVAGIVAF